MRDGPSDSDCRIRVQTTASCSGPNSQGGERCGKGGTTRQVSAGKTNASEPSLTCRKRKDVVETRLQSLAWDEARKAPADWPSGNRHEDGVRPARGFCAERGNLCRDAKGDLQAAEP